MLCEEYKCNACKEVITVSMREKAEKKLKAHKAFCHSEYSGDHPGFN